MITIFFTDTVSLSLSLSLSGHEDTFSRPRVYGGAAARPAVYAGLPGTAPVRPAVPLCRPRYNVRQTPEITETHSLLAVGDFRLRLRSFAGGEGNGHHCAAPPSLSMIAVCCTQAAVMQ